MPENNQSKCNNRKMATEKLTVRLKNKTWTNSQIKTTKKAKNSD
jgi:hypothetical protein